MSLLVTGLAPAAAADDVLNVGFAGSLVGTDSYTTTGGESMSGTLHRIDGDEKQLAGGGVRLSGPSQGIEFTASDLSLGDDSADTSFIAEIEFTPTSRGSSLATLLSAGGNMYVRVTDGALEYGFDYTTDGDWSSAAETVTLPELDEKHQLSVYYTASDQAELHVSLDGTELPPATADQPFAIADGLGSTFGFGNEVNPGGAERGFPTDISRVRVSEAPNTYDPEEYAFQPEATTTQLLDLAYTGSFSDDGYTVGDDETLTGDAIRRTGDETVSDGTLTLSGKGQALDWTSEQDIAEDGVLDSGFVSEVAFTPDESQSSLATLLAVGGNLFARYDGDHLEYGFSAHTDDGWQDITERVKAPEAGTEHVFSMAYVPTAEGATLFAALDGTLLTEADGSAPSTANSDIDATLSIGNEFAEQARDRGFSGTIDKTRFATLTSDFSTDVFAYQDAEEPEPEECDSLDDMEPANYISVSSSDCPQNITKKAAAVRPTKKQQEWQEVGLTAFVHFGINTFYDQEWGNGTEDPGKFDPTDDVDVDSWVRQLRDAGFRYAVLTVKHHDGFLSYPSRYTDYDVASTPWKDGQGNILREFTDAAHRYGMKVGVYMSPADSHEEEEGVYGNGSEKESREIPTLVEDDDRKGTEHPTFTYDATDYGAYFLNTLYEVLTEYGEIDEVWFDGAEGNTTKHEVYDYPAFYDMIEKLQPNAVVAVGGRDVRWVGNEQGEARTNEWAPVAITDPEDGGKIEVAGSSDFEDVGSDSALADAVRSGDANSLHWWPSEADMKLTQGWFAHPDDTPKSGEELLGHYERTAGRNAVMLLNVPPTTTGSFAQESVDAINDFAAERRKAFTRDHVLGVPATTESGTTADITDGNARTSWVHDGADSASVTIDLGETRTIDRVSLSEDTLEHGQTITDMSVEARVDGAWTQVAEAGSVGVKRILTLKDAVEADALRVTVNDARATYSLSSVSAFETLDEDPGLTSDIYVDCSASSAGTGTKENPLSSLEQFRDREIAPGTTIHLASGTDCDSVDVPYWGYGTDDAPITVTSYGDGDTPLIGGDNAAEHFASLASQDWTVDFADDNGSGNEPGDGDNDGGADDSDGNDPGEAGDGNNAGGQNSGSDASGSNAGGGTSSGALPWTGPGNWALGALAAIAAILAGLLLAARRRRL